jgi:hypothetical protein
MLLADDHLDARVASRAGGAVRAEYLGTRDSAPSASGFAQVLVR